MCPYHVVVIRRLAEKDHVGDEESNRAAVELARQCPQCVVIVGGAS